MAEGEKRMQLWLRVRTVLKAVYLFGRAGEEKHEEARQRPGDAADLRSEAEEYYDMRREFRSQLQGDTEVRDSSVTVGAHANVNYNKFTLTKDARELMFAALLALSVGVNVWCAWIIRDIGTRKWLHDWDLNQFQQGDFAKLQNKVDTLQQVDDKLMLIFGPDSKCRSN